MLILRTLIKRSKIHASAQEIFSWHMRTGAFERLIPPTFQVSKVRREKNALSFLLGMGVISIPWMAAIEQVEEGKEFTDIQVKGPFASWKHKHRFVDQGPDLAEIEDRIEYRLPLAHFGYFVANRFVQKKIQKLLIYRHETLKNDLERIHRYDRKSLKIVIAGGVGFIGSHLSAFLNAAGHQLFFLTRKKSSASDHIYWNPDQGEIDRERLENCDIVINLCGENIGDGYWTKAKKKAIYDSRINTTRFLVNTLNSLKHPPSTLINASAVGYYGSTKGESDENAPQGKGFLAEVCRDWEKEALQFSQRVVITRFGSVLSPDAAVLKKMIKLFNLGLGSRFADGKQSMSFISIDDLLYSIYHLMMTPSLSGVFNLTIPKPITNQEFCHILKKKLHRPCFFKTPTIFLKMALGDMADELLLVDSQVIPKRLLDTGMEFAYPDLKSLLDHLLV